MLMHYDLFLIDIRLKKCVTKLSILLLLQYNSFPNAIRLKTCVKAADTCPFVFDSVPDQYKTQEMCDKNLFPISLL